MKNIALGTVERMAQRYEATVKLDLVDQTGRQYYHIALPEGFVWVHSKTRILTFYFDPYNAVDRLTALKTVCK